MNASDFVSDPGVREAVESGLRSATGKAFSDVSDSEGHQYVDLVLEGGGVLGVALLGYTWALEQFGIRFYGVGGTSAGSIVALLLAALDQKDRTKSERLVELLANQDLYEFVDGGRLSRALVRSILRGAGKPIIICRLATVYNTCRRRFGLNPGREFCKWIGGALAGAGIKTTGDLLQRVEWIPEGLTSRGSELKGFPQLSIVAAEIRTETRVEFPRMASLFWEDWRQSSPADFVRASMSVPIFFQPFRVSSLPTGQKAKRRWEHYADWRGPVPENLVFVDGGVMSNFPIDLFHQRFRVPSHPTFGVKLGRERIDVTQVPSLSYFVTGIFNSARHCLDFTFVARNPDYRQLLAYIDTGPHHWLDLRLSDEAQIDLFPRGVSEASRFVQTFDWQRYKETRASMAIAYEKSRS